MCVFAPVLISVRLDSLFNVFVPLWWIWLCVFAPVLISVRPGSLLPVLHGTYRSGRHTFWQWRHLQEWAYLCRVPLAMPRRYAPAPGCAFPPTGSKTDMTRHLKKHDHCPCKRAGWTVGKALDPASITRKTDTSKSRASVTSVVSSAPASGQSGQTVAEGVPFNVVRQGIYVGKPNGEWSGMSLAGAPLISGPDEAAVLKFGCSDNCAKRVAEHQRSYKGFKLLAWFPTQDYRGAEAAVRSWLQVNSLLAHGVNSNKASMDTELVLVNTDEELDTLKQFMEQASTAQAAVFNHQAMEEIKLKTLQVELEIMKFRVQHNLPVA